jgi:hypothetical protein
VTDIGPYKTTMSYELVYGGPNGPPIEVEVEVEGILYCDDPEWGVEVRDVTAKVLERELTEEEVKALDVEPTMTESFCDSEPCHPRPGEKYKDSEGKVWTVFDTCLTWKTPSRERYVILERHDSTYRPRSTGKIRRLIPLDEFAYGVEEGEALTYEEDKSMFTFVLDKEPKPGELRPHGS